MAKIENFHWHDLRHTFASRVVMAGADLYPVKKFLGHHDMKMTERYADLAPDFLKGAVDLLTKKIGTKKNCRKGDAACKLLKRWCARPDSNGRPADSKSDALSN